RFARAHHEDARLHRRHPPRKRHRLQSGPRARHLVSPRATHDRDDRRRRTQNTIHEGRRPHPDRHARRRRPLDLRPDRPTRGGRMKLYGSWSSSSTWRVRIALHLKKVAHENISVHLVRDAQFAEEFKKKNPSSEVPLLEIAEGKYLSQSTAILVY